MKLLFLATSALALAAPASATLVTKSYEFTATALSGPNPDQHGSFSFQYDDADPSTVALTAIDYKIGSTDFTLRNTGMGVSDNGDFILGGAEGSIGEVSSPGPDDFLLVFNNQSLIVDNFIYHIDGNNDFFLGDDTNVRVTDPLAPVPEPATWAMMLVGFGAAGYTLRRRTTPTTRTA